jgi:hypothetical protein
MSLTIEPGALRDADTINAVLQEAEDKVNTVLRDSMLPNGIIPEVLLSGLVNEIAHCGEVSSTEVTLAFQPGDVASSWSTLLSLTEDFSGSGYGDDEQQMQVIEIDDATCGGVVVEWDLCLDRVTSWEAPAFAFGHAFGEFIVEVIIEVCNNSNTASSGNWYMIAGPFYQRNNAVFTNPSGGYPVTEADFNAAAGSNNPVISANIAGAVLINKAAMMAAVGSPTAVDIYGVRARARAWISDNNYTEITGRVTGLSPITAVFDIGSSRLMVENTRTGVLA